MARVGLLLCSVLCLCLASGCGGSSSADRSGAPDEAADADVSDAPAEPPSIAPAPPGDAKPAKERKVVVLDPGHGGDEVGSVRNGVVEKDSNLEMAFRVEKLLRDQGVDVVLTRRSDSRAAAQMPGLTATRSDLQARLDLANAAGGDVFVSIHSNGSEDQTQRGVEVWYDSERPFAREGLWLAQLLQARALEALRSYGYAAVDRGLNDGRCFRMREGRCFTLFVIAGARATSREEIIRRGGNPEAFGFGSESTVYSRPAKMPAALIELLIVTNPADAAVLRQDAARQAMARGLAKAIVEFLGLPYQET